MALGGRKIPAVKTESLSVLLEQLVAERDNADD
jgi:hypothetical protein